MKKVFVVILIISSMLGIRINSVATHVEEQSMKNAVSPVVSENIETDGKPVEITGKGYIGTYNSLLFINENIGWVVEENMQDSGSTSKVLRTKTGGVSWEGTDMGNTKVNTLYFVNETIGWAISTINLGAENTGVQNNKTVTEILTSRDGGITWDRQWESDAQINGEAEIWFKNSREGFALIGTMLLSTSDGGNLWQNISFGINGFVPQHMSFTDEKNGWLIGIIPERANQSSDKKVNNSNKNTGPQLLVLKTTDGGLHWSQQMKKVFDYGYGPVGSIDIQFINSAMGWFLTSDMSTMAGELYFTQDGGEHWGKINKIGSARPYPTELEFITPDFGWIPMDVGAGPISGGFMITSDGGKNFKFNDNSGDESSMLEVDFINENQGWAIGNAFSYGHYLIRTQDGGKSWQQIYPEIRPVVDIAFYDNNNGYGLGQLSDSKMLLATDNGGESWEAVYKFDKKFFPTLISFVDNKTGWVLTGQTDSAKTAILKTLDGGRTWKEIQLDASNSQIYLFQYIRFFDKNNGLLISQNSEITTYFRSTDGGNTWLKTKMKDGSNSQFLFDSAESGFKVDMPVKEKTVNFSKLVDGKWQENRQMSTNSRSMGVAGVKNSRWILTEQPAYSIDGIKTLLYSEDGGSNWASFAFSKDIMIDTFKSQIPMQFTDSTHGWMLSVNGLLKTENGGLSWKWCNTSTSTDIPVDWIFKTYNEYGYKIAYPKESTISVSGGHSPSANPDFETRLTIFLDKLYINNNIGNKKSASDENNIIPDDTSKIYVDIDSINHQAYKSIDGFISKNYQDRLKKCNNPEEANSEAKNIYKLKDDNYYYVFYSNQEHIYQLSSSSIEALKNISRTFKLI